MDVNQLRNRIQGRAVTFSDPEYESLRSAIWNRRIPEWFPRLIVQVASEQDVVEAVHFARGNQMKISVRGGGHSWVGFSLRDDSLLIDLGLLKQASIDMTALSATVQPAVTGRELQNQMRAHEVSFPVGHCPNVPFSGFLLSGGLGWNTNTWGPACFSVVGARVVTADGVLVTVNQQTNPDLFWAIRGGGPGFFGVVTAYKLQLYRAPSSIIMSTYFCRLGDIEKVGAWAASIGSQLPREVEFTLFIAKAPLDLAETCRSDHGYIVILSAVAFVDDVNKATESLKLLNSSPFLDRCLKKDIHQQTSLDGLLDLGEMLWPKNHRYQVDTLWTNSPAEDVLATLHNSFLQAPSSGSLAVYVFPTGGENGASGLPDAAFSMTGRSLVLCYAIWEQPEHDKVNIDWHHDTFAQLESFAAGHYIGESDIVAKRTRVERSFATANWQRLQMLRRRYDPQGLFDDPVTR